MARCPNCKSPLDATDKQNLRCPSHGNFQVLFDKETLLKPTVRMEAEPGKCARHPESEMTLECETCETALCQDCEILVSGGRTVCPLCAEAGFSAGRFQPLTGKKCVQHADVQALNLCKVCGLGVCATCDFSFGSDLHLCPACVLNPSGSGLNSRQKKQLAGAYALSIFSFLGLMIGLVVSSGATTEAEVAGAGFLLIAAALLPSMGGIALASSTFPRKGSGNLWAWGAVVLNGLVAGVMVLLSTAGTFMG